jgi:hypothetical protein
VNLGPEVEVCANCGAPLDLDEAGACRWCHARIRARRAPLSALLLLEEQEDLRLVPDGVDNCGTSAPFLYLTLTTFGFLSTVSQVKEYMRGEPGLLQHIRALTTAVSDAGVRVRDTGLLKDDFDDNLTVYTPEEIWTFDLAFDVIAMLGALNGLDGQTRARIVSNMRSLNRESSSHAWKKDMKKAGDGPLALREFRSQVPHRSSM